MPGSIALAIAPPSVETLMGPCFLLFLVSFILYGLILAQVYFYFTTYRDHVLIRLVVALLCVLETLHVVSCVHMLYAYMIIGYSHPKMIREIIWSARLSAYTEAMIGGTVELHYIYRIWGRKNIPVLAYLIITAFARIVLNLRWAAFMSAADSWASLMASSSYRREGYVALAFCLLGDLSVTTAFLLALNRNRSLAHTRGTKNIVQRLMHYALSSGILTAIISIITFILFVVFPSELHSGGTLALLTKAYANSMLAMLNRREGIKRDAALNDGFSLQLSNLPKEGSDSGHPTITKVQVTHDTVTTSDTWFVNGASKNAASESGPRGLEKASEISCV